MHSGQHSPTGLSPTRSTLVSHKDSTSPQRQKEQVQQSSHSARSGQKLETDQQFTRCTSSLMPHTFQTLNTTSVLMHINNESDTHHFTSSPLRTIFLGFSLIDTSLFFPLLSFNLRPLHSPASNKTQPSLKLKHSPASNKTQPSLKLNTARRQTQYLTGGEPH